jgi:hypothetical protein
MNKEEFIEEIIWGSVVNRTWEIVESLLSREDYLSFYGDSEHHNSPYELYANMSELQQETMQIALRFAIDIAIWNVLMALSDQSLGRIRDENGKLVLYHKDENGKRTLLTFSEDDCEQLHELFHGSNKFPHWMLSGKK